MPRSRRWTQNGLDRAKKRAHGPRSAPKPHLALSAYFPAGLPGIQIEYRFHPTRRWRFDVALPQFKIAVEQEGGIWTGGRHTRGKGYLGDLEKYNAAVLLGWRVLRYPPNLIRDGTAAADVRKLLAPIGGG